MKNKMMTSTYSNSDNFDKTINCMTSFCLSSHELWISINIIRMTRKVPKARIKYDILDTDVLL